MRARQYASSAQEWLDISLPEGLGPSDAAENMTQAQGGKDDAGFFALSHAALAVVD
jgi:hypothetical protein